MLKGNKYRISIDELSSKAEAKQLQFEIQDREDIFNIIEKLNQGSGLKEEEATRLALALRLLGPVMMENRKHPLFAELMPHFKDFMHNLKTTIKKAAE